LVPPYTRGNVSLSPSLLCTRVVFGELTTRTGIGMRSLPRVRLRHGVPRRHRAHPALHLPGEGVLRQVAARAVPLRAGPQGRGVTRNKHSTDVESTNRVRASARALTLRYESHAPISARVLVLSDPAARSGAASMTTRARRWRRARCARRRWGPRASRATAPSPPARTPCPARRCRSRCPRSCRPRWATATTASPSA